MISKELKKLSRRELVDIIYQLKKNEQDMQEKIEELEEALQDKRIRISAAGSIAEAAVDVTNVISAAQQTADLYLQEIALMKEETEKECERIIGEASSQAEKIVGDAKKQYADFCLLYKLEYKKWEKLQEKMNEAE